MLLRFILMNHFEQKNEWRMDAGLFSTDTKGGELTEGSGRTFYIEPQVRDESAEMFD